MPTINHLPIELLETFVMIVEAEGDAGLAAQRLGITQPSISKRLSALRRATSDPDGQPWLILKGRRWLTTAEGTRVRSVVADLLQRYQEMEKFVASGRSGRPCVSLACGQFAAGSFVRDAVQSFLRDHPEVQVRVATPRGKERITGVAGGQYDISIVTDTPDRIRHEAQREMYIEDLFNDRFVLAANPNRKAEWGIQWHKLPVERPVKAADLLAMPMVLPEPDASRRQQFDAWVLAATGRTLDVVLEVGGWQTILDYVDAGIGVGLATVSTVNAHPSKLISSRPLDPKQFPPDAVRLIARKAFAVDEPDISPLAMKLVKALRASVKS